MRTVYFDLETGGLELHHPIIQLAAIVIDDETWKELAAIEMKIQFDITAADPESLKVNHYDAAVWRAEAVPVPRAIWRFAQFLEPHKCLSLVSKRTGRPYSVARLAGHNAAGFDAPRLQKMYKDADRFLPADPRVLDTLQLAMWYFQVAGERHPEDFKLGTLCRYFDIPVGEDQHDALADVRLTAEREALQREWRAAA